MQLVAAFSSDVSNALKSAEMRVRTQILDSNAKSSQMSDIPKSQKHHQSFFFFEFSKNGINRHQTALGLGDLITTGAAGGCLEAAVGGG